MSDTISPYDAHQYQLGRYHAKSHIAIGGKLFADPPANSSEAFANGFGDTLSEERELRSKLPY